MKFITAAALIVLLLSSSAPLATAQGDTRPPRNGATISDQGFLQDLARLDHLAIALGELALVRGRSQEVRKLGQDLASEHRKNFRTLQKMAAAQGIMLPKRLANGAAEEFDAVNEKHGEPFDQAFVAHALRIHQEAILLYENAALGRGAGDIRDWAREQLPNARKSLSLLRESYPEAVGERIEVQSEVENR